MDYAEAEALTLRANSYSRMGVVLSLREHLTDLNWFRLLGDYWSVCDNIASHRDDLKGILQGATSDQRQAMMTEHERSALARLPDTLTVYRGCYLHNLHGLSWTLDKALAARFPTLNRYRHEGTPLLVTGRVSRERAVLKLDRKESEVIASNVRETARESLIT